jgi:hypothetical protein
MSTNPIPAHLDWVKVRAQCSIQHVFKELELGVCEDVEQAQSLVGPNERIRFSVAKSGTSRFAALRINDPITSISHSVYFSCRRNEIQVSEDGSHGEEPRMTATLTLTNEGHCKLKVGNEELYQWQFRRMALEGLFFGVRE